MQINKKFFSNFYHKLFFFPILIILIKLIPSYANENGCEWCKRTAVLSEAINLNKISISTQLFILTTPCFHLQGKEYVDMYREKAKEEGWDWLAKMSTWKPPEYVFHAIYETDLEGKIKSRMTINLYFDEQELVASWNTESERPTFTYDGHINKMFKNSDAVLRKVKNLEQILWDFEKTPVNCKINPEHEVVVPDEEIDVDLKDFEDIKGNKSREFNRIVVQALEGKILGGEKHEIDPDLKVFQVGNGSIKFKYKAPESCEKNEDEIYVYNSCDILRKNIYPLSKTQLKNKIAEQKIRIECPWKGTITSTVNIDAQGGESFLTLVTMYGGKLKWKENWEIDVVFKLNRGNERIKIYKLKTATIKFQQEMEADIDVPDEKGKVQMDGKFDAQLGGRKLSPSECNLSLIFDQKKKTYKINGTLQVENIPASRDGRLKVDVGLFQMEDQDTDEDITEIDEDVLIEGKYSEDEPKVIEGSLDILKECPPDFQKEVQAFAGKFSKKFHWKLSKEK